MWDKKNIHQNYNIQNHKNTIAQKKNIKFPSKAITLIMNSESQSESEQQYHDNNNSIQSMSYNRTNCPSPPLVSASNKQNMKQNSLNQANKMIKQIRYSCYRVQGQKLLESRSGHYNSINLQEASMIRDNNEMLQNQLEKIKEEKKQLNRSVISLENQNKAFRRQLNLLKQQMETKDNVYEELEESLIRKTKEVQKLEKKILVLDNQLSQLRNQSRQNYNSKKRQGQLSKYLENQNKKFHQPEIKKDKEFTQKIYSQVSGYIIKRIQQLKNRLMQQKMSHNVENILEEFMAQMVNINPMTVSRAMNKTRPQQSSTRSYHKLRNDQQSSMSIRNGLFRESQTSHITPPKQENKERADELRNLQKSLQKLREMQKEYISNTPNISNNFNSLDRSSLIGLDKSNRSKSRRKKIFE